MRVSCECCGKKAGRKLKWYVITKVPSNRMKFKLCDDCAKKLKAIKLLKVEYSPKNWRRRKKE
ncbi:hypothetical protein DRJ16_00085 [Candidatus Woesearchaeota archaeon]|nr:MAG: hypothetical protein DRJ16_00085 [Candidatus Woesearchaeota archaeon]